jgi:hypothetical protein
MIDVTAGSGSHGITSLAANLQLPAPRTDFIAKTKNSDGHETTKSSSVTSYDSGVVLRATPLVRLNSDSSRSSRRFQLLQQFEGVVTEVGGREFSADLRNLTDSKAEIQIAEFDFLELAASDRPLVVPGAVFYWVIGYDITAGGTVRRMSEIRLKRSPTWSTGKLASVKARAAERFQKMMNFDGKEAGA